MLSHDIDDDSYLDFFFDILIKRVTRDEPFVRENHYDNIRIENSAVMPKGPHVGCFAWQSDAEVLVRRVDRGARIYPLNVAIESMVRADLLEAFMGGIVFEIVWNGTVVFDVGRVVTGNVAEELRGNGKISKGDCSISLSGDWLRIEVRKDIAVTRNENQLRVSEKTLICEDDAAYLC